jgi:hypothetical protein
VLVPSLLTLLEELREIRLTFYQARSRDQYVVHTHPNDGQRHQKHPAPEKTSPFHWGHTGKMGQGVGAGMGHGDTFPGLRPQCPGFSALKILRERLRPKAEQKYRN